MHSLQNMKSTDDEIPMPLSESDAAVLDFCCL
jgi:hypothetical protein